MKKTATYHIETDAQAKADDAVRRVDYKHGEHYSPEHDRLNGATLALPDCGCTVVGRGTLPFPIRIKFCEKHRSA